MMRGSRLMNRISWLGRFELPTLLLMALLAAGVWGFIELADEVAEGDTHAMDESIVLAMRSATDRADPLGPKWLEELGRDLTALGGVGVLTLIMLTAAGYLALLRKFRAMWFLLITVIGGQLLSAALKYSFDRPRPDLVPHGSFVYTSSFPSGHSTMAAVTYLTIGALLARVQPSLRLKAYLLFLAIVLSMAVGVSRVYLGVHYPSDVLAGWTIGGAWAVLCWLAARWLQRRGKVETDAETPADPADVPKADVERARGSV